MQIHEEPIQAAGTSSDRSGRDYIVDMIRSLSRLARSWREDELAVLLDAIAAAAHVRDRG